MKKINFFFIILVSQLTFSQNLTTIKVLPSQLNEISGIDKINSNTFICHNDGGNPALLYLLDSLGNIKSTIFIDSVTNVDFEDITLDNADNLYIADVGNNNFNRTNLVIYKVPNISNYISTNDTVVPEKIFISYQDQTTFPDTNQNSDCEATVFYQNNLYLFTKDWSGNNASKVYRCPTIPGTYSLIPQDTIFTNGFITGGDLSGDSLVLLQMNGINLYTGFVNDRFKNSTNQFFSVSFSQKESICFVNDQELYLAQEDNTYFPSPKLFSFKFPQSLSIDNISLPGLNIYPNPCSNYLFLDIKNKKPGYYTIYNTTGELLKKGVLNNKIDISDLNKGVYILKVKNGDAIYTARFVKN